MISKGALQVFFSRGMVLGYEGPMSEIGHLGQVVTKYLAKREMCHEGTLIHFKFDAAITLDSDVSCMVGRHMFCI